MTYEDFFSEVKEHITGYLPEQYRNSSVTVRENTKNNMKLHGIAIQPEGMETVPFIYLEPYCDRYNKGEKMETLMREIADTFEEYIGKTADMELPDLDYRSVGDYLRVRLVNSRTNAEMLRNTVSRPVSCGFSLVAYIDLEKMTGYPGFITVTKELAETIGCDEKELLARAMENSVEKVPAVLSTMQDVVYKYAPGWESMNLLESPDAGSGEEMFVLSNTEGEHGAAALYYPGVQEKISEIIGGDYYVLPSSIHEVLIISDELGVRPRDLAKMVKSVNETQVAPVERLADKVLHYRSGIGRLEVSVDMEKKRETSKER